MLSLFYLLNKNYKTLQNLLYKNMSCKNHHVYDNVEKIIRNKELLFQYIQHTRGLLRTVLYSLCQRDYQTYSKLCSSNQYQYIMTHQIGMQKTIANKYSYADNDKFNVKMCIFFFVWDTRIMLDIDTHRKHIFDECS